MIDFARFARGVSPLALAAAVALTAVPAHAQDGAAASQSARSYDIPAQPLDQALAEFAREADVQLAYSAQLVAERSSPGVEGRLTAKDALAQLLAGTGLTFRMTDARTFTLMSSGGAGEGGELTTGVVSIEGYQRSPYFGGAGVAAGVNGINGSRDITATEGTGSFTSGALTIGSKVPQAMKDVPQSISVLTSERLEQQNVTDFTSAMRQLPGVTLVQDGSSLQNTFYSRGFAITSIQVDGGAPLVTSLANGNGASGFVPQIDMSIYDHVELLRGAAGQFGAYGEPGGMVNLVRKKPLDHAQVSVEAQVGSWSNYRVVADATSPLALDGKLRGRLVMTYQDNKYFYDTASDNKTLIYGIAELDLTPTTLLTAGINHTRQDSVPWLLGLPRYLNGDDLMLPRSTSFVFPWNRWDFDTTEIFGGLEQKIGEEWNLKLNLTRNRQSSTYKLGLSRGAVNPTNGLGPQFSGLYQDNASTQLSMEGTLSGAFTLFGQRQELTIGVNRADSDGGGQLNYSDPVNTYPGPYQPYPGGPTYCFDYGQGCPAGSIASNPPIDVFNFDPSDPLYTEPRNSLPTTRYTENGQVQSGAYINLRLTAFDRVHLITGLKWSRYVSKRAFEYLCTRVTGSCTGKVIGDAYSTTKNRYSDREFSWPPPVSLSFDATKALTFYVGYTDIYQSQANYLDADLNPLLPLTGSNWEAGAKWAARDGRLNLSLAAYRIRQQGFSIDDPNSSIDYEQTPLGSGIYCCFVANPNQTLESKGIDLELTGEVGRGWQVVASYTYNDNQYKGSIFGTSEGLPFVSIQPKHLYKLWMSYDFGAAGHAGVLSDLTLSGGVNGQSSGYRQGNVCIRFQGIPDPITGEQSCAPNTDPSNPSRADYRFTVPAYALFSARVDYRLSDQWSLALNLDNILDETYYQTTGSEVDSNNWYGTPRSLTASIRAKW